MITSIYLDGIALNNYNTPNQNKTLENLSKINLFIGPNNSGKSRFIRTLFSDPQLKFKTDEVNLPQINNIIERLKSEIEAFIRKEFLSDAEKVLSGISFHDLKTIDFLSHALNLTGVRISMDIYLNLIDYKSRNHVPQTTRSGMNLETEFHNIKKKHLEEFDILNKDVIQNQKYGNIYIPTLRGMRMLDEKNTDVYLTSTISDYFGNNKLFEDKIITGLKLNEEIKEHLLGNSKQRKQVRDFEKFLSKTFFDEKEVNIIPKTKGGVIYFMIGNEEKEIYNLGDGVQSIIILTYPLFFNQGKYINFFIEEPEHYLHPGFQRIFIETLLLPQFKNFQYFITTHSNHLLDITLDINQISIYTLKKKIDDNDDSNFIIENVENEDSNTLELIGVRNSSVFLSNSTIWVEGITDRIYLRKYLDIFQQEKTIKYIEDIHYSFVEYGGGNITHWSFLDSDDEQHSNIQVEKLCAKLFLISDKDNIDEKDNSKKALRQKQLAKKLAERYYCLESIEIENTLVSNVIKKVVSEYEKGNNDLKFKDSFTIENYKNRYLGKFIDENIEHSKRTYAEKSGTINDKLNFAKKAVSFIQKIEDMSDESKDLSKRLYDFIAKQNTN